MKLHRVFLIALMTGILGVMGCGDDPAPSNGTGGTPSNGSVCDDCANQSEIPLCVACYEECTDTNPNDAGCAALAIECCNIV
jgi:hypothetical protein